MAHPTELADLTAELKERIPDCRFRFEWSSKAQGSHLILCGDWNRCGRRSSRTLHDLDGSPIKKQKRPLSTNARHQALEGAAVLTIAWAEGADTRQRKTPSQLPTSTTLARQRRVVIERIRAREGGHGIKQKHHRHARALFSWLDDRNQMLDAPNAILWAGEGVQRNTDTYADRLRMAQWACQWNALTWVVPEGKRAKKPEVSRPFVDHCTDAQIEQAFTLITDPAAAAFFRVVAATGCRPGEVALFDWARWIEGGRGQALHGYSKKVEKDFTAICNPLSWLEGVDLALLVVQGVNPAQRPISEEASELRVRHYSRLLKLVQRDLRAAGWQHVPTWTDLRHLWTIRAELSGFKTRVAAMAQAHSHKMAQTVYLRHAEQRQVLAEIQRVARLSRVAC
jgi:integrase